jgi:hypothetical protein
MYMLMRRHNSAKADTFVAGYLTGVGLSAGSPVLALRERVLQYKNKGWKILHPEFMTWVAYAWRAHLKGKSMQRLSCRNLLPTFPGGPKWDSVSQDD